MPPQNSSGVIDDEYGLEPAKPATAASTDDYGLESPKPGASGPNQQPQMSGGTEHQAEMIRTGKLTDKFSKPTEFEKARSGGEGFWSHIGSSLKDMVPSVKDVATNVLEGPAAPLIQGLQGAMGARQEFKAAQERGHGPAYSTAAATNALLGVNPERMEQAAEKGDTAGVLGETAVPLALSTAPMLDEGLTGGRVSRGIQTGIGKIGDMGASLAKKVGEPYHIGMSSEELLKKGVSPRAQATGWDEAIARPGVQRALVEHNQAAPIKSAADLDEAIPAMKEKIWTDKVQPALDRQGKRPVDMKPAADAVRAQVTDEVKEFEPEKADELNALADKLEKSRDVEGTNRLLKYVNGKLESYFSKYPSARRANLANNPDVAGWEAARRAIREQFMDTLEQAGEAQVADARKDYGALETIGKEVERRVNVADRQKPMSLPRILGIISAAPTAGIGLAAGEVAHHFNKPDVLIRHGIERLNPPAETPFTPPAKFTPAAAPAPAAVQQTLGLPRPEHGPLFNIQQTPRLPGEPEEPRIGTISGQQQPLNMPESPEQAPLFSIPQTTGTVPEQPRIPKFQAATSPIQAETSGLPKVKTNFRGTAENVKPVSAFRTHDIGNPEVDPRAHAHATESAEEAEKYKEGRGNVRGGRPQTVSQINLSRFAPDDIEIMEGPNGKKWYKFKRQLTKEDYLP